MLGTLAYHSITQKTFLFFLSFTDGAKINMCLFATTFFLFLGMSPVLSSDILPRLNYGVIFQKHSKLTLSREYWLHTFEIPLPKFVTFPAVGTCTASNDTCLLISHVLSQLNAMRLETDVRLNKTLETIHRLVPHANFTKKSKSKRALLPFIGRFSKTSFGQQQLMM